jgi:hypothetical protein
MDSDSHREFMLAALRVASSRVRLMGNEIDSVGVALGNNLIGAEMAVRWIHDLGLMFLIEPLPPGVGQVALMDTEKTDA